MRYVIGENWRDMWDATIVSAGKPRYVVMFSNVNVAMLNVNLSLIIKKRNF